MVNKGKTCSIHNCNEPAKALGFCSACYSGWKRLISLAYRDLEHYRWKAERLFNRVGAVRKRKKAA